MRTRTLGTQGLTVSALGLGCMGMSQSYGDRDATTPSRSPRSTAPSSWADASSTPPRSRPVHERGAARPRARGPARRGHHRHQVRLPRSASRRDGGLDSRPEHIREAVEGSLRGSRTDRIDLLYQHRVDPRCRSRTSSARWASWSRQGKVRFLGLREAGEATIRRAHAVHPISALQSEYSLWERNLEAEIIPLLRELGIGLVPFARSAAASSPATSKRAEEYAEGDFRRDDPRYQGENFDANMRAAAAVREHRRRGTAPRRRRSRSPGCCTRGDGHRADPGHQAAEVSGGEPGRGGAPARRGAGRTADDALSAVAGARYNAERMSYVDR